MVTDGVVTYVVVRYGGDVVPFDPGVTFTLHSLWAVDYIYHSLRSFAIVDLW